MKVHKWLVQLGRSLLIFTSHPRQTFTQKENQTRCVGFSNHSLGPTTMYVLCQTSIILSLLEAVGRSQFNLYEGSNLYRMHEKKDN